MVVASYPPCPDHRCRLRRAPGGNSGRGCDLCWWCSGTWDRAAAVWSAFSIGCLWITLFGPSTELATYVFLAPSVAFACSWVLLPVIQGRQPLHWFEFLPIAAYALLLRASCRTAR